jgi:hypothetical protein
MELRNTNDLGGSCLFPLSLFRKFFRRTTQIIIASFTACD